MIDLKQSSKDKLHKSCTIPSSVCQFQISLFDLFCSRSKKKHPTKENGIETKQPPPQLAIAITTMPPPIINHSQRVTQQHYPYPLAAAHILFLKYTSKYSKKYFHFFLCLFCSMPCWSLTGKVGTGIICSSSPSRHSHSAGSHFMVGISQVSQAPLRIQLTTYTLDPSPMYTVPPSAGWQLLRC